MQRKLDGRAPPRRAVRDHAAGRRGRWRGHPGGGPRGQVSTRRRHAPDLGAPVEGSVRDVGEYRVVARPLFAGSLDRSGSFSPRPNSLDGAVAFVQYAKPRREPAGHPRPPAPLPRSWRARRHGPGLPGGLRGRAPRNAPDRRAHPGSARGGPHARPRHLPAPSPRRKDEVAKLADTLEDMLRELDAARGETEAALERQREFVADASHELRTPLTSILANLELLEDELTPDRRPGRPGRRRRHRGLGAALVAADAAAGGRPAAARPRGRRAARAPAGPTDLAAGGARGGARGRAAGARATT